MCYLKLCARNYMLSQSRLRQLFRYDDTTGGLYWVSPTSRAVREGQRAGRELNTGYRQVMVDGRRYLEHRLVWVWHYGAHPQEEIDHINGRRSDNRVENLREATKAENQQNIAGARRSNATGLLGVSYHAGRRWRAQIRVSGVKHYLGLFPSPEQAHQAYLEAKAQLHRFQPVPRKLG